LLEEGDEREGKFKERGKAYLCLCDLTFYSKGDINSSLSRVT
jgi:hypothetical protein